MSERTDISFDAALMMALRADAQRELDSLPTPKQFEEIYPDTSQWDERMTEALKKKKHHPVLKRVLIAALTLVMLTVGALAVSADFRRAVYTMIQKFLPIEMQLTYQVDGEPLDDCRMDTAIIMCRTALKWTMRRNLNEQKTFYMFTRQKKQRKATQSVAQLSSQGSSPCLIMSIQCTKP